MKVETLRDQSIEIKDSVYSMLREAILGAIMAVLVTLLFLRNIRSTIIAVISIPLSILAIFYRHEYAWVHAKYYDACRDCSCSWSGCG